MSYSRDHKTFHCHHLLENNFLKLSDSLPFVPFRQGRGRVFPDRNWLGLVKLNLMTWRSGATESFFVGLGQPVKEAAERAFGF